MAVSIITVSHPQQNLAQVRIDIDTPANWAIAISTAAWLVLWGLFYCWTAYGIFFGHERLDFNLVQVLMLIGGVFSLRVFSRNLPRKESILLTEDLLQIRESGLLSLPITYELALISYFSYDAQAYLPEWKRFWGLDGGKVAFGYMDMKKRFGYKLTESEAEEILEAIRIARQEAQASETE